MDPGIRVRWRNSCHHDVCTRLLQHLGAGTGGLEGLHAETVSACVPVVSACVPVVSAGVPMVSAGVPVVSAGVPVVSELVSDVFTTVIDLCRDLFRLVTHTQMLFEYDDLSTFI